MMILQVVVVSALVDCVFLASVLLVCVLFKRLFSAASGLPSRFGCNGVANCLCRPLPSIIHMLFRASKIG
ncbi:unnamed protein product [Cuscuta campestris]|uniref:Uncharacterized protein n=1 Tax=Cuscuta campestris TaxID=132261 RepID=A0A484K966_9ASTE|nr:unnamed protein product [Cuscuta campestris]